MDITISGPLFSGAAPTVIAGILTEAKQSLADQGLANVHQNLDQSIRHPTPYYETQITVQPRAQEMVVHDRGIIYGPWLEGISHRNQTTSFKGYHSFRRATHTLRQQAPALLAPIVKRHLGRLG